MKKVGAFVQRYYDLEAKIYRNNSDPVVLSHKGVTTHNNDLAQICSSFNKKIDVLDLCCGTGRYFHALKNVEKLTAVDFSSQMLKEAQNPINKEKLDIQSMQLIAADVQDLDKLFSTHAKFDFIYSIGALGEYTAINLKVLDIIYEFLSPGGKIYLTTLKKPKTFKMMIMKGIRVLREMISKMDHNLIFTKYALDDGELIALLGKSKFKKYTIKPVAHTKHIHNVIIASKE
jgi:ubiquinone/menaquinone biosynthesis C-methylase UbiE